MKIELTNKEICILFFCVKELANRCRERVNILQNIQRALSRYMRT